MTDEKVSHWRTHFPFLSHFFILFLFILMRTTVKAGVIQNYKCFPKNAWYKLPTWIQNDKRWKPLVAFLKTYRLTRFLSNPVICSTAHFLLIRKSRFDPSMASNDSSLGKFTTWPKTNSTTESITNLRRVCNIQSGVEIIVPTPRENPENVPEGYCSAYEYYFYHCGLQFPIPNILVRFLAKNSLCLSQLCPNSIRQLVGLIVTANGSGSRLHLRDIFRLVRYRRNGSRPGTVSYTPRSGREIVKGLPDHDGDWWTSYFYFKVDASSVEPNCPPFLTSWMRPIGFY